jgi:hypothetical protein
MDLDEIPARLKLKSITFDLVKRVASKNVRGASTLPNEIVILSDFGLSVSCLFRVCGPKYRATSF